MSERLPGLYRAFREAEEPQREALRLLIARVTREMHRTELHCVDRADVRAVSPVESGRKSRVTIFEVCLVHSLSGGPVRKHTVFAQKSGNALGTVNIPPCQ